jgi:hypothetical protein
MVGNHQQLLDNLLLAGADPNEAAVAAVTIRSILHLDTEVTHEAANIKVIARLPKP